MSGTETTTGAGSEVVASAQALQSVTTIVRAQAGYADFGPLSGSSGGSLRDITTLSVANLPRIWINVFLFPEYDRGDTVFRARNFLEFRPVFRMPSADWPDVAGVARDGWLPLANPMIIPVGAPLTLSYCCTGIEEVAIEVRIPANPAPAADQGEDRIIWSISGSQ